MGCRQHGGEVLHRNDGLLFPEVAPYLDVGHGDDFGQLEAVAGRLHDVAGGEDVGVIAEDVGEDRIVIIVRDEPIDLSFDCAQRNCLTPMSATSCFQAYM